MQKYAAIVLRLPQVIIGAIIACVLAGHEFCTHTLGKTVADLEQCLTIKDDPGCFCTRNEGQIKGLYKKRNGDMCIICGQKCPTDQRWFGNLFSSPPCSTQACSCDRWEDLTSCTTSRGERGMYCSG